MKTVLFDLDGTLIDHFTTIHRCVVFTQQQLDLPESDYDTVRATVGGSAPVTLGSGSDILFQEQGILSTLLVVLGMPRSLE